MTKLLRVDEVAERLGLKAGTIRKMIYRRELPVVRPTKRSVRVREDDLDSILRRGSRPTNPRGDQEGR